MVQQSSENRYCYICGYDLSQDPDNSVKFGTTCPCCLFEYGIDDSIYGTNGFMDYRENWINKGFPFMGKISLAEEEEWNLNILIKQLSNLKYVNIHQYFLNEVVVMNQGWTPNYDLDKITNSWNKKRAPR